MPSEGSLDGGMGFKIYVETSVISYLTSRPSRDVVIVARQEVTREWWRRVSERFQLSVSELVLKEARMGDLNAAQRRLDAIKGLTVLKATDDAETLARALIDAGAVAQEAWADAVHIAIAATNGADFLVTWNFRHIANAAMRSRIEQTCRNSGNDPPVICTPDELMEA